MRTFNDPLATFFRRLRRRRVVPWTLAYLAGAWIALESTAYLVEEYGGPARLVPFLTIALAFGVLFAITAAWYHGEAGWQPLRPRELSVYGAISIAALGGLWAAAPRVPGPADVEVEEARPLTRVAVLPTRGHTPDGPEGDLLVHVMDALTHHIGRAPALQVQAVTAVAPFRTGAVPLDDLARRLGVGAVVESSVTQLQDSLRLTVQLVETQGRGQLGSWIFSAPAEPPSVLLNELVPLSAQSIRQRLGEHQRERDLLHSTASEEALTLYLRARVIERDEAPEAWVTDPRKAVTLLAHADSLLALAEGADPDWVWPPLLRSEVANLRSQLVGGAGTRHLPSLREGIDHATRALAIGRDSALALERRGSLRFTLAGHSPLAEAAELYRAAEADMREALRIDPDLPGGLEAMSRLMARHGNHEGSYQFALRAYRADSFMDLAAPVLHRLSEAALRLERFDLASAWCDRGRELFPRSPSFARQRLLILSSIPEPDSVVIQWAWAASDSLASLSVGGRRDQWLHYGHMLVASMLAGAGMADSAEVVMRRAGAAMRGYRDNPRMVAAASLFEAYARLRLGQRDSSLALLADYARLLPAEADLLATSWWFRDLRSDPAFLRICCTPTEADRDSF
jgi:TolB-like protein